MRLASVSGFSGGAGGASGAPVPTLSPRLRTFVARQVGVERRRLRPSDSLFHDFGVDGDDGDEFMERFGDFFGVDVSAFEHPRHFGDEGIGFMYVPTLPIMWLYWQLVPKSRPPCVPITLADLEPAIRTKRWATPATPPR